MDSREVVGWICLTLIALAFFLASTNFVSTVNNEIAEGSVQMTGGFLDSLDDAGLDRFRALGRVGQVVTGAVVLTCLLGGSFRAITLRKRGS